MSATWTDRYPDELAEVEPFEWHDDKPSETACNMAVSTCDGDMDTFGRALRPGT